MNIEEILEAVRDGRVCPFPEGVRWTPDGKGGRRELWLAFHAWVKAEIAKREENDNGK